jgi:hypothetical protein
MKFKSLKFVKICLMIKIKFLVRIFVLELYFATIISIRSTLYEEKEGSGSASGSVLVTSGSGCGSRRPKNIRILRIPIRNTGLHAVSLC